MVNIFTDFRVKSINGKQLETNPKIVRPFLIIDTIQRFRNRTTLAGECPTSSAGDSSLDSSILNSINSHSNSLSSFESIQSKILNTVTSNTVQLIDMKEKIIALNDHLANLFALIQANGNKALKDVVLTRKDKFPKVEIVPADNLNTINITTIKT